MAEPIDDGGPAFPQRPRYVAGRDRTNTGVPKEWIPSWTEGERGLSLRDYFAGQALAGMAGTLEAGMAAIISMVFATADAMIAARGVASVTPGVDPAKVAAAILAAILAAASSDEIIRCPSCGSRRFGFTPPDSRSCNECRKIAPVSEWKSGRFAISRDDLERWVEEAITGVPRLKS